MAGKLVTNVISNISRTAKPLKKELHYWQRVFVITAVILQMVLAPVVVHAADPKPADEVAADTGANIAAPTTPSQIPASEIDDLVGQINNGDPDLSLAATPTTMASLNAWYMTGQETLKSDGQQWSVSEEHYGADLPRIGPGVIERKLLIEPGEDDSLILSLATKENAEPGMMGRVARFLRVDGIASALAKRFFPKYKHKIPLSGRKMISATYDNDHAEILLDDGSVKIIDTTTLRELIFKYPVPVFSAGIFQSTQLPKPNKIAIIESTPENLDFSDAGRMSVPTLTDSNVQKVAALSTIETATKMGELVEKGKLPPLHPKIASLYPVLKFQDRVLIGTDEEGKSWVVAVLPKNILSQKVEEQDTLLVMQGKLMQRDSVAALEEMVQEHLSTRKELEEKVTDPALVEEVANGEVADAIRNLPLDVSEKILAASKEVQKTDDRRGLTTIDELIKRNRKQEALSRLARWSANKGGHLPMVLRKFGFAASEKYKNFNLGEFLRKTAKVTAYAGTAAGGVALLVNKFQSELISMFPIYKDGWDYPTLLWTQSIPGQMLVPLIGVGAVALVSPFFQRKLSPLIYQGGNRAFARIQQNPARLVATLTGQLSAFEAAKDGNIGTIHTLPHLQSARENSRVQARNLQIADQHRRERLANLASYAVASLQIGEFPEVLWALDRNIDLTSPVGSAKAFEVRELILSELESLTPEAWRKLFVDISPEEYAKRAVELQAKAIEFARSGKKAHWMRMNRLRFERMAKLGLLRTTAQYSEATFRDLADAEPTDSRARQYNRHSVIDFVFSLGVASHIGDWAGPSLANRHAQPGGFLSSSTVVNVENMQQLGIGTTRGAATDFLTFMNSLTGANKYAHPLTDFEDKEVVGYSQFAPEARTLAKLLMNVRQTNPAEYLFRVMKRGRVQLAQSTFLIGFVPWLLMPAFEAGSMAPLSDPSTWIQAATIQSLFMARALWAFAWPIGFTAMAINEHEEAVVGQYTAHQELRRRLAEACRLDMNDEAEVRIKEMLEQISQHSNIKHAAIPERVEGETAVSYGDRLVAFTLENPCFAVRPSNAAVIPVELGYTIASTTLATFMYSGNKTHVEGLIQGLGENYSFLDFLTNVVLPVNLTDWNIVTHIPEGEGIVGIGLKSTLYTYGALGVQRTFNVAWDAGRLGEINLRLRGVLREQELLQNAEQKGLVPARLAEVAETRTKLEAEREQILSNLGASKKNLAAYGPIQLANSVGTGVVRLGNRAIVHAKLGVLYWQYSRLKKQEAKMLEKIEAEKKNFEGEDFSTNAYGMTLIAQLSEIQSQMADLCQRRDEAIIKYQENRDFLTKNGVPGIAGWIGERLNTVKENTIVASLKSLGFNDDEINVIRHSLTTGLVEAVNPLPALNEALTNAVRGTTDYFVQFQLAMWQGQIMNIDVEIKDMQDDIRNGRHVQECQARVEELQKTRDSLVARTQAFIDKHKITDTWIRAQQIPGLSDWLLGHVKDGTFKLAGAPISILSAVVKAPGQAVDAVWTCAGLVVNAVKSLNKPATTANNP